jgi:hypothetical protein
MEYPDIHVLTGFAPHLLDGADLCRVGPLWLAGDGREAPKIGTKPADWPLPGNRPPSAFRRKGRSLRQRREGAETLSEGAGAAPARPEGSGRSIDIPGRSG